MNEAKAAEAAHTATNLANQAASEALQSQMSAQRTKAEADAASAEAVSVATQASLAVRAAGAARASSQAITDPANTAIAVVAPFTGQDIDADFVVLVANQASAVGAEQAAAAQRRADEALEAARLAQEAAQRAAGEVKPAFDAAAAAAMSSAEAARSAAEAQKAAAEAAIDGAAARASAARANQADAQAREDAIKARNAANAAASDAALAGRSAAAAERDASAARSAASAAEADAAAARGAATRAETDATAAESAADSAQQHADAAAEAAKNAYNSAVQAGQAADRAEAAERERAQAAQKSAADAADGNPGADLSADDDGAFAAACRQETRDIDRCVAEYTQAYNDAKKSVIDWIIENGGQVLLDMIGVTDAKKCFGEGDIAASLWTVVNVGSLLVLIGKLPAVSSAIGKIAAGLTKFLEGSAAGRRLLSKFGDTVEKLRTTCGGNSFTSDTPVLLAGGTRQPIKDVGVGDKVVATDPATGRTESRVITKVIGGTGVKHLVEVTIDIDGPAGDQTGTINATAGHPFWAADSNRWLLAADITRGTTLLTPTGQLVRVVDTRAWTETRQVYNLTISGIHTYYVSASGVDVLVHNADCLDAMFDNKSEAYVKGRHVKGGADVTKDKSTFNPDVDLDDLVEKANKCDCNGPNPNGRYERDVDAGRIIGNESEDWGGAKTEWYRVVQDKYGGIITMHPIKKPS